ncbi:hypothetical protein PHYBLDRAFT_60407 [Phycomyces blakesleeanus NRRL 1555(-)]|uniref:Uncharacterized protein n=1 Tax=Phycomyces blakesleeanus (strain ATCC 8743b / DSM 1359 / FGSC 10004 / NBRC 33097 / NRRL 1555) TaxID=763407 RepID=A0A162PYX4_PHYB8|nr:hypothetical protein PHYBLDRAFT_60407 [Phycomyces blakesleeanus NRRL 1555(-)]OAD77277.1 hypothetical protein PHYBLDRAFT_60407 [Phycomyces blakesleeanus NRRL 1555(-)]|eukprot:XP_018295317.1 hypothetical protein PHYBLDRAFT_60407 [Phycomyces blakesleeanus NRRL 1555(-)]
MGVLSQVDRSNSCVNLGQWYQFVVEDTKRQKYKFRTKFIDFYSIYRIIFAHSDFFFEPTLPVFFFHDKFPDFMRFLQGINCLLLCTIFWHEKDKNSIVLHIKICPHRVCAGPAEFFQVQESVIACIL